MKRLDGRVADLERKSGIGTAPRVLFVSFVTAGHEEPSPVTAVVHGTELKLIREALEGENEFLARAERAALETCSRNCVGLVLLGGPESSA